MSRILRYLLVGSLLAGLGACASADKDAAPAAKPAREVAAGGARLRGGKIRMDVQLGRAQVQAPGTAGTIRVAPNAVVTP